MKPTTKRVLMTHMNDKERRRIEENGSSDMRYGRMGYDYSVGDRYDGATYNRFRDDRGREHYDNGRYAPMRNEDDDWVESRQRRDSRGRYMSPRNEYGGHDMRYRDADEMSYPTMPPIYRDREEYVKPMNRVIGFSLDGEMDTRPGELDRNYISDAGYYGMDETSHRKGRTSTSGYSRSSEYIPFTKSMAKEWTDHMENEDGTKGPHWTMEQTKQVMAQKGVECDPLEFFVTLNIIYSDYCGVAKKLGVNTIDFYTCMAKAFLDDKDAVDDKLSAYYTYIVKH